jgi:casein kinase II subunit beta
MPLTIVTATSFYSSEASARSTGKMSTSSGTPESWISSFCSLLGHEYFAEVSEEFIEDDFNLTGLQTQVAMYKEALEVRTGFLTTASMS